MPFVLAPSSIEEFRQAFSLMDGEQKGYVTAEDIKIVLQALRIHIDPDDLDDLIHHVKGLDRETITKLYDASPYQATVQSTTVEENEIVLQDVNEKQMVNSESAVRRNSVLSVAEQPGFFQKRKMKRAEKAIEYRHAFDLPEFITFMSFALSREYNEDGTDKQVERTSQEELDRLDYVTVDSDTKVNMLFEDLDEFFEIFEDKTSVGYITKDSLKRAMDKVGEYLPEDIFDEMFHQVDFAQTGKISREQFLAMYHTVQ